MLETIAVEPQCAGFSPSRLSDAVAFALANEINWSRNIDDQLGKGEFEPPPWNEILGPTTPRGGPAGVIMRHGQVAATWGDVMRADMTFSVAKSYLAILTGLALADGLIVDINDRVADTSLDDHFSSAQNRDITWLHLLQQTSEWEGTLFSKSDLIDRNRQLGAEPDNSRKGQHRDLGAPGSHWEYNDVRVNRLSLSLLHLFRRPLADVLRERIMEPIGASNDWSWNAYRNATVTIDGVEMPSVPGGSHWGGGLWIGASDQAKLGQLILQRGAWDDRQLLAEGWIDAMFTPCAINPEYGYMWWLNTDRARYSSASAGAVAAVGAGGNTILVEPAHDLVLVARWLRGTALDPLIAQTIAAIRE
ncbi:MAG: serine hydrolase [Alphaproteobacteria bacterium]|jgi:CubicO group peptidase (beta-lactamase class C family)|nr:serine hydrolase [Alphaproteobacteria bacterium]MDP7462280.1 serine hydrolase [Alphaproteobacteria bacterium]HJM93297.1 serine hydrolase [Alphaproteobacteria bacterium]|tara:strand:- start:1501 stop:2586 length:1086 start_codon:yes stop_codon:yes gene_type:complete